MTLTTILYIVFGLGILIFFHELGHFLMAKKEGVRVDKFSLGFGPKIFGFKWGETEYVWSIIPLGGYVKMAGMVDESMDMEGIKGEPDEFLSKSVWARLKIIVAGPLMNFVLAFLIFVVLAMVAMEQATTTVSSLIEGYPAAKAGMQVGDKIVKVDGEPVEGWSHLLKIVTSAADKSLVFSVDRDGNVVDIPITPVGVEANFLGKKVKEGKIGITPVTRLVPSDNNFFEAVILAGKQTAIFTELTYKGLWMLVTGKISSKNVHGPIFIAKMAGEQAKAGLGSFFFLIALISINLAVLNLLPVPILDGGHCMFLVIEGIIRRPVSIRVQDAAQRAGMVLLFSLMLFATYNDLLAIFGKTIEKFFGK